MQSVPFSAYPLQKIKHFKRNVNNISTISAKHFQGRCDTAVVKGELSRSGNIKIIAPDIMLVDKRIMRCYNFKNRIVFINY